MEDAGALCDTLPTRCGCHDETFSCQMFIVRQDSVSQDVWIERISILILRYIILIFCSSSFNVSIFLSCCCIF